jgi:hypothetical protein
MKVISRNPLCFAITRKEFEKMLKMKSKEEILNWVSK